MKQNLGPVTKTSRGFEIVHFSDLYQNKCSLQQSSLAIYEPPGTSAVWLGVDDPNPKILASQAARNGIETKETTGWVPYPIPKDISLWYQSDGVSIDQNKWKNMEKSKEIPHYTVQHAARRLAENEIWRKTVVRPAR